MLKPNQSKEISQENNTAYVYMHFSALNEINLKSPKMWKNLIEHQFRIGESFSNMILEYIYSDVNN